MLLPTMARTSQTLTQNQTPSAMRKVAQRSPTRLMSQKKSNVLSELVKNTPAGIKSEPLCHEGVASPACPSFGQAGHRISGPGRRGMPAGAHLPGPFSRERYPEMTPFFSSFLSSIRTSCR
jgi:hypothetical protein